MMRHLAVISMIVVMTGCAGNGHIIETAKVGVREDVFQKVDGNVIPAAGYSDMQILSSIKTHREGAYIFEKSDHGKPGFLLLVNIDGHVLPLGGEMRHETGEHIGQRDPEAGVGTRYTFNHSIRLKPGLHMVTVAIPDDDIVWKKEIHIKEGKNRMEIKPVYRKANRKRGIGFLGDTSYSQGIKAVRVLMNNEEVKSDL